MQLYLTTGAIPPIPLPVARQNMLASPRVGLMKGMHMKTLGRGSIRKGDDAVLAVAQI
jgi:hypothetical protein